MAILACTLIMSCKSEPPTHITTEYLSGKKFSPNKNALMGGNFLEFIDTNKVNYTVHDKRSYGYRGTYTLEYDEQNKQFIKIVENNENLTVIFWVKSPTELEVVRAEPEPYQPDGFPSFPINHTSGTIYELVIIDSE